MVAKVSKRSKSCLTSLLLTGNCRMRNLIQHSSLRSSAHHLSGLDRLQSDILLRKTTLSGRLSLCGIVAGIRPSRYCRLTTSDFIDCSFRRRSSVLAAGFGNARSLLTSLRRTAPRYRFFFTNSDRVFNAIRASPRRRTALFGPQSVCKVSGLTDRRLIHGCHTRCNLFTYANVLCGRRSPQHSFQFIAHGVATRTTQVGLKLTSGLCLNGLTTLQS